MSKKWSVIIPNVNVLQIERVEVKDVRLPQNLQRAMAAEAEATREARAKVGRLFVLNSTA